MSDLYLLQIHYRYMPASQYYLVRNFYNRINITRTGPVELIENSVTDSLCKNNGLSLLDKQVIETSLNQF